MEMSWQKLQAAMRWCWRCDGYGDVNVEMQLSCTPLPNSPKWRL